jgi:HD-GYP domain-containing protein (c-di-GMP phosphodiesterase class II)/DNA-binding response OmpR family regulator
MFSESYHLQRYAEIGMSLSGEEDINTILEMILNEARELTCCDAGSLYMINEEGSHLDFVVLQNDTMKTRMGGTSGVEINLPPVPLRINDEPNHANVSSHVALTGEIVKIADVYESEEFDFTGPRNYDQSTGYRSKSMLVIPMRNHENDIIGVMQLLNAMDPKQREVIEFHDNQVSLVASLASQAAAALTKTRLIQDLKNLFYAFIKSIAGAIEEKSPYTGGHINRVVDLSMMMAEKINEIDEGPLADVRFSEDDLEELKLAAWLHDVGKITTPEYVVDKSSKLETIFDRVKLVEARFDLIAKSTETAYLRRILEVTRDSGDGETVEALEQEMRDSLNEIAEDREFIISCNEPGEFMSDDRIEKMRSIGAKVYTVDGETHPYLTEDEMMNLSIRKGTLTESERKVIENHATMTGKILGELPFPKKLAHVPEYAAGHHEKMDGTGYPLGLKGRDLSIAARIMAVADIFEALTAKDRPYKKPMQLSQAIRILGFMRKDNHIDSDIHDMFLNTGLFREYANRELLPWQVDEVDVQPSLKKRRVALVTDDAETETSLMEAFESWGAEIDKFSEPEKAVKEINAGLREGAPYRIMVLDMDLVQEGSLGEMEEVSGFPAWAVIPVGGNKGCDVKLAGETLSVLGKPVDAELLKTRVGEIIKRPLKALRPVGIDRAQRMKRPDAKTSRVLIADTSANTRMLFQYYMSDMTLEVDTAASGQQALSKYQSVGYDLLIIGMHLSGMSGFEAVKRIRGFETAHKLEKVPIIGLTAHYITGDKERSMQAGCTETLTKPATRATLTGMVESLLSTDS